MWEFAMEDPSDLNARVVFNMGTSATGVYLDNISLTRKSQQRIYDRDKSLSPEAYQLSHNYPNPFNPETGIDYQLPESSHVVIDVVDILGRHVKTLVNQRRQPGRYHVIWNGINERGLNQASGVYIISMQAGSFHAVRKMTLLR